jgi:CRISPR-associated exonuclease Cas4
MSPVSVILLLLGALLLSAAWWLRRASGLPGGEITYADTDRPAEPLISNRYGLVGKPDYVVMQRGMAVPVEVKPNRSAGEPYESDRLQVLAYCLLLEETNAKTPPFGVLRYRTRSFRIGYTARERAHLIRLLDEIRSSAAADDVARSHRSAARCAACGFRRSCEQSLAA